VTSLIEFRKPNKFPDKRLSESAVEIVNKIENLVLEVFSRSETTAFEQLEFRLEAGRVEK
jgi:hypothetical protein